MIRLIVLGHLLLICASVTLSAETERSGDTWSFIVGDFRNYALSTNSPASEKALVDRLHTLVQKDWTNAPQNLNTIFSLMEHSTNGSSHLKFRISRMALFSGGPPITVRSEQARLQFLTNILNVLEITKDIYSGIDPQFDPHNAPGNKVTPPPEMIQQGYQIPSANKSYTNSPLWKMAVLEHKAKRRVYEDQISRRKDFAELLQFIKAIGAMPPEYRTIVKQKIRGSNLPVSDKETLEASLASDTK